MAFGLDMIRIMSYIIRQGAPKKWKIITLAAAV